MTTIDAVSAWRAGRGLALSVLVAFMGLALGGCETATNLFSSSGDNAAPSTALADQAAPAPAPAPQVARIAIAPVIGAPDTIARQIQAQLTSAIESKSISVAKLAGEKSDFTLRGYIVSARERSGTKVSYIWDVTDPTGKRSHRITGEEIVPGAQGKDPWASVSAQVVDSIASKTAASLASWMPSQSAAPTPVASIGAPGAAPQATVGAASPVQTAALAQGSSPPAGLAAPKPPVPTTGSIGREGAVSTMVPTVVGAPGDGSMSLTGAIQRELQRNGVSVTERPAGQTYRVEGKVVVGEGKAGKQPIQIDWDVKDPQGKKLGTVSQKNEIPQGSLDGAWGKTADAAAAAATQGILKLLPPQTKVN